MHYFSDSAPPEDRRDYSYLADWETLFSKHSAQFQGGTLRITPGAGALGITAIPLQRYGNRSQIKHLAACLHSVRLTCSTLKGMVMRWQTLVTTQYMAGTGTSILTTGLVLIGTSLGEAERTWIWIKSTPAWTLDPPLGHCPPSPLCASISLQGCWEK